MNFQALTQWLVLVALMLSQTSYGQFWSEDFEVDGAGVTYIIDTPGGTQFSDGAGDFFTQIPSGTVAGNYVVTGQNNTGYFAAMDTDGDNPGLTTITMLFDDVDISGETDLEFRMLLAEDDDGANQDWDAGQLFFVEVDIDNSGTFTKVLQIASAGPTNTEPGEDSNFDGVWDSVTEGPAVTSNFETFVAAIAGTGSVIDIRLTFETMDAGDEDIAIDYLQLHNTAGAVNGCTNAVACNYNAAATLDDGSCILIGDVCDDANAGTINDMINGSCVCEGEVIVNGCTDVDACNYNAAANVDDASCDYTCIGCSNPAACNYGGAGITIDDGSCLIEGAGCDDGNPFTVGDVITAACACEGIAPTPTSDLMITAVYDGPLAAGAGPKGVELYAINDIPDLSNYGLGSASNGGGTDGIEFTFPADAILAGTYIYVSANGTTAQTFFATAAAEYNGGSGLNINGNDAMELFEFGQVIDVYGEIDVDGTGMAWEYLDTWAVRNCETGPDGSTWVEANWTFGPINVFDAVDANTGVNADAAVPMPVAAYLATCPTVIFGCTNPAALNYDPAATDDDGSCVLTVPDVVINEVHYNPCGTQGVDPDYEFTELYNNSGAAVDLSGWIISGAVDFTFPAATSIADGEYIVITTDETLYTGNGYQVFQCTGSFNNTGETITLNTELLIIVDQVGYSDAAPWPTAADGSCPSAELIDFTTDNSDGANWQASWVPNGTPGAVNSTAPPVISYTIVECQTVAIAGENVETAGIVTAVYAAASLYTIQDGTGPNSGIWCEGTGVALGDDVQVSGLLTESFDLTLITGATALVLSSGNALPAAEVLGTLAINDEQWEGVLVETTADVSIGDAGNGEWAIDDASGQILIDDLGILIAPTTLGDTYTVTGPLYYSFSNYKIEPRDAGDVQKWGCTDNGFPNYDADAVIDDGSCALLVDGCTDILALNYDPAANNDDGSCYYTLPDLVINEIHYNPCTTQGDDAVFEYLEIYNNDVVSADLEGYTFSQGVIFTFGPGATIAAGEYIILASQSASYTGNGYQVFQITSGAFGNSGETVEIQDAFGNTVDIVTYANSAPWPGGAANGGCSSLELIDFNSDNADGANWQASYEENGTPGAVNSTPPPATAATIVEIQTIVPTASVVLFSGIVTAVYSSSYTVQDGVGPYTGVWVNGTGVAQGDDVTIEGTVAELFTVTTINPTTLTINSSANALPQAINLGTLPVNDEQWEGVLITTTAAVSVGDAGFGEFALNDGTGNAFADDLGIAVTPLGLGDTYTITGPLWFSFGAWKIEPRDAADVQKWGCTDANACNYDVDATIEDHACDYSCVGCTDAGATNYDAGATIDDGSCFIAGCMYPDADNYDMTATLDNGTCTFTPVNTCPADLNGDLVINTGDLSAMLSVYGTTCP